MLFNEDWLLSRFHINVNALLFWMFVFSVFIAIIMFSENRVVEWERRKQYAEKLAFQTDPANQRIQSISLGYVNEYFLRQNAFRFFDQMQSKKIRDSIINTGYSGYLNNYDTRLYVFSANYLPVYNEDSLTTYQSLEAVLNQSQEVQGSPMRFYETAVDKFAYIIKKPIYDYNSKVLGFFYIITTPHKSNIDNLLPELFSLYTTSPEEAPVYYHAIYVDQKLTVYSPNYPFPVHLTIQPEKNKQEFSKEINNDYEELWYRVNKGKTVIVARKRNSAFEAITLFSYLFCSFLVVVFIMAVIILLSKFLNSPKNFLPQLNLRIRNQIHATFILINLFSFLVIGLATIGFLRKRYDENNSEKLSRIMSLVVNNLSQQQNVTGTTFFFSQDSLPDTHFLQARIEQLSSLHGINLNIYDLNGNLQHSSERSVYNNGVLSIKMEPRAYYNLSQKEHVEYSQTESITTLHYLSLYNMLRYKNGKAYAYLNIPYFTSRPELNKEISNFIVTIVNLNAFIFILGGLIALLLTNRITRSFSFISKKMQDVNLTTHNEEIVWNRDDEIVKIGVSADSSQQILFQPYFAFFLLRMSVRPPRVLAYSFASCTCHDYCI